jgi:hypothetical protein
MRFAPGEAQRVYDFLVAVGCVGNDQCEAHDFKPSSECTFHYGVMGCNDFGRIVSLYIIVVGVLNLTVLFLFTKCRRLKL